jgi:hypothetical protein
MKLIERRYSMLSCRDFLKMSMLAAVAFWVSQLRIFGRPTPKLDTASLSTEQWLLQTGKSYIEPATWSHVDERLCSLA